MILSESKLRLILTDTTLTFTPMGRIQLQSLIKQNPSLWSELLISKHQGEYDVIEPKPRLDGRDAHQRFLELLWLTISIRVASDDIGFSFEKPSLTIEKSLLKHYIPRYSKIMGSPVWIGPNSVMKMFSDRYPEIRMINIPHRDLPSDVSVYAIDNCILKELLRPYTLVTDPQPTFTVINPFLARIDNVDLKSVVDRNDEENSGISIDEMGDGLMIRAENYSLMIQFYIKLKLSPDGIGNILFVSDYEGSLTVKIIKNSLWAPVDVLSTLKDSGILDNAESKELIRVGSGSNEVRRVAINNVTFSKLIGLFGKNFVKGLFKVRLDQKIEIVGETDLLNTVFKIIDDDAETEGESKYSVVQKTVSTTVIQGIRKKRPYVDLLSLYFKIKLKFSIELRSELDLKEFKTGIDAFEEISRMTDFSGGRPTPMITKIDGELYLTGEREAAFVIFNALPDPVKEDITLQEISPEIFGRQLSRRAYSYIQLLLN